MSKFNRGLNDKTLKQIKIDSFLNSKVGQKILENDNCLICIRNNYINVYYNGCSLLKYKPLAEKKYLIHQEYLPQKNKDSKHSYVSLTFDSQDLKYAQGKSFMKDVLESPSDSLRRYIDKSGEKKHIAKYLKDETPFLIDLEIAFEREKGKDELKGGEKERDKIADRIDMATINENFELQMIEVKMDSDSRLKSKNDGDQKVLKQMKHYKEFIKREKDNILASYKSIAKNFIELNLLEKFPKTGGIEPRTRLETFIARGCVDMNPHLLIIETGTSMEGRDCNHFVRLTNQFKKNGYPEIKKYFLPQ